MRFQMRRSAPIGDDEYADDEDDVGGALGSLSTQIFEQKRIKHQFTGILNADGEPIFRVLQRKPGMGFTCWEVGSYDPDLYCYAIPPFEEDDFLMVDDPEDAANAITEER